LNSDPEYQPLQVPARTIHPPVTISHEARAALSMPQPIVINWPADVTDKDAVAKVIAEEWDTAIMQAPELPAAGHFGTAVEDISDVHIERIDIGDFGVYVATPEGVTNEDPRTYMTLHGAWISGGGELSRLGAAFTAKGLGIRTWAVDYRMPPHHPYPVPLDDCVTAYKAMLERYRPENLAIGGTSGGGNLGMAFLLRAHHEGLPMPVAAAINSPYADLSQSGDTHQTLDGVDISYAPGNLRVIRAVYLDGHDVSDPFVSPLLGNYTAEFPPTLLISGTRDFLLSDTVRLHRRLLAAGVKAELHVWEAAPHSFFYALAPEDAERVAQIRTFLNAHWGTTVN
jgi:monoterpene epsilon-lactone hydrolase